MNVTRVTGLKFYNNANKLYLSKKKETSSAKSKIILGLGALGIAGVLLYKICKNNKNSKDFK